VKRLRYDAQHDVMLLGGTTKTDANQHWKPMGPVIARYDGWRRAASAGKLPEPTWTVVAPYERGAHGHESCEPMGFDIAGDYIFVPYTGASKAMGFSTGHVEVFRAADGKSVGHSNPPPRSAKSAFKTCASASPRTAAPTASISSSSKTITKPKPSSTAGAPIRRRPGSIPAIEARRDAERNLSPHIPRNSAA
jgi:hypothetical protein